MTADGLAGLDPALVQATLLAAAEAAAERTLAGFRTPLAVENKWETGFDPVTAADRDAEIAIRAVLAARFPEHGIIGEEWDPKASAGAYDWIVDPIDGTRAFISGVPVWGTLIGLMHRGRAVAGLMAQPFTGETYLGLPGTAVYSRHGETRPLRTSGLTELGRAKVTATSPDIFELAGTTDNIARLRQATLQIRWGLDCYGYCLLAAGHIDIVAESMLKNVDIAPLIPIIENAGGVVTTWDGGPAEAGGNCVAAATPELHEAAMRVLRG
ncbi:MULTISPECIES: histidinol-phosphatase [unclassified Devosia]|uniref:histidinol-phosphatase n=1 Tax=unclassified Devosia TaxID=196773 RepID=UPI000A74F016|nr:MULTISPECIES: histidinol-phosphatase [unclassified Devosia]MBN9305962.1 histidinol-phosphatase [Devosia sp.]